MGNSTIYNGQAQRRDPARVRCSALLGDFLVNEINMINLVW